MKTSLIVFNDDREPIVVSDEEITKESKYLDELFQVNTAFKNNAGFYKDCQKIIAQGFSQIDFNGLESEFGVADVEKLCPCVGKDFRFEWINGFKANQQLKGFSEEDMRKAYTAGWMNKLNNEHTYIDGFNKIIQSLQQPKIFEIEVEMETWYRDLSGEHKALMLTGTEFYKPKFIEGKLKILRKL